MEKIYLTPVVSGYDVELVREMRNECRKYMTRFTDKISERQQREWYSSLDKDNNFLYILRKDTNYNQYQPIGYGYIRIEKGKSLLTGGLTESQRDRGYGTKLFSLMIEKAKQFGFPIELEVLKTNKRAYTVYKKLGFNYVSEDDNIIYMEYRNDPVI
jgi:ribosomal protein S18 acetylase RimI-like enzyme